MKEVEALPPPLGLLIGGWRLRRTPVELPSVNVAWWKSDRPFLSFTQPGGAGSGCFIANTNLQPGGEYWDLFSFDPCVTIGSGPSPGPLR